MTRETAMIDSGTAPKVGYVLKRYPRFSETFVVNEILAHEAAGQPVEIFALREVAETHFQDIIGRVRAPVTRVPERFSGPDAFWSLMSEAQERLPHAWNALRQMGSMDGRDVAQAIVVALAVKKREITHLHAHFGTVATSVARLAAALAGISYSFTAHAKDIYFDYAEPQHLVLKLRDAAEVVTVSDYNVAHLSGRFPASAAKLRRIYNGLDLQRFAYAPPRPDAQHILAVGRLVEKKGFHILIESIRLLHRAGRNVTCRIVGQGEEQENLAFQIADAGLEASVRLIGPLSQEDVVREMRSVAVLACPCVVGADGNRDGLPTVLLEAMALGLPCIATGVTGIPELVRDGETGLLVPEGDPEALAEALLSLLDSDQMRRDVSQAGRRLMESNFDIAKSAAELREVFKAAVTGQQAELRGAA